MNKKAMLILTLAAFITGCSSAPVATTTTAGQTTSSGITQPVVTAGSSTSSSSNSNTSPATTPTTTPATTVSSEPVKAEPGKPIIFDGFEITINSIKKFAKGIMVDYTFVNRQEDAFSPNYMLQMQFSQDGKPLFSDPFFRYEDKTIQKRANYRSAQIRKDVPVNLMGFYATKSDTPITVQLISKIGSRQKAIPFVMELPKEEFKVSDISPEVKLPADVKPIADNVPALKVGDVLELKTMKVVVDGIYAMENSQGLEGVILEYTRTRNSAEMNYQTDFYINAFQSGKSLNTSSMNATSEILDALRVAADKLLPGISVKSLEYVILSETKVDLEFEFNEWKNFNPVKRTSIRTAVPSEKITIAQLEEKVKVANAANNAAAKSFVPQTEDRTVIGKKIENKDTELTIQGVRKSKDDKYLILDISFMNRSTNNQVLAVNLIVAYQNGVQLSRNYNFSDPADQMLNNNLSSGDLNKPMDGILSYRMRDNSMIVIEIYDKPEAGQDFDQKQVLVIKP